MENLTELYGERDACGVGFVAESAGARFDRALPLALTALKRLEHRGAVHADGRTGDGAGVLTAIPPRVAPIFEPAPGLRGRDDFRSQRG